MVHILNSISTEIKDTFFGLIKLINLLRTRKFLVQVISWSNNHKNNSIIRGAMPFHIRNVKENVPEKSTLSIMLQQDLIVYFPWMSASHCFKSSLSGLNLTPSIITRSCWDCVCSVYCNFHFHCYVPSLNPPISANIDNDEVDRA